MKFLPFSLTLAFLSLVIQARADIRFDPLKESYRSDRPITVVIRNSGKRPVQGVVTLEGWGRGTSQDVVINDVSADPRRKIHGMKAVPAHGKLVVRWTPNRFLRAGLVSPGSFPPDHTYQLIFYTTDALRGGGAVYTSTNFKLVKGGVSRKR